MRKAPGSDAPGGFLYFSLRQVPLDTQPEQPHPQPDFPSLLFLYIRRTTMAAAASTMASTRMVPQFSRRN